MLSHTTRRRAALLSALAFPALLAVSCAPHSHPAAAKPPHAAPPPIATKLPAPAHSKTLPPTAFPDLDTSEISSLTFSPDGRRLAFGYGTDDEVTLWNLQTGRLAWQRHVDAASGGLIQFGPEGNFLVAQFGDPDSVTPIIVSSTNGRLIRQLASFYASGSADLEEKGRFLVIDGMQDRQTGTTHDYHADHLTEVWDTHTWRRVDRVVVPHPTDNAVFPLSPIPLTGSGKIIRHAQLQKNQWPPASFEPGTYRASNDKILVTASDEQTKGQMEAWDSRLKKRLWTQVIKDVPRTPAISPDGKILAVPTLQGNVYFWSLQTGQLLARTHCSNDVLRCLAFSPSSRVLAAAGGLVGTDGVRLLDMRNYKLLAVLKAAFGDDYNRTQKDWSLNHPQWFASLPNLSYMASAGVVRKIRTPGRARDAKVVARFERPERVRAALRECYER